MTYKPRTVDQIYNSIQDNLQGKIGSLTNFTETSFNYVWTRAFSRRFRDSELALLATQLSGWVDYSGGPITRDDLDRLGVSEDVNPEDINQYMEDDDLDALAEIVGTDRGEGEQATGTVTFTTQSQLTTIPAGTSVGTDPDANNDFLEFTTDNEVESPVGSTEVDADITAVEVGEEYNVGSASGGDTGITYLPSPPTGVQDVSNTQPTEGGESPETNDEFRDRIKEAIFSSSGGGTAAGVRGFVRNEVDEVVSVAVKEYPGGNDSLAADSPSPGGPGGSTSTTPFADVIVQGGNSSTIQSAIDDSRPVAIQHNLVRPNFVNVGVTAEVEGTADTSESDIESAINNYLSRLNLGENVYRDKIIQGILNASDGAQNISYLEVRIEDEKHIYDSDNSGGNAPNHPLYKLNKGDSMEYDSTDDSNNASRSGITSATAVVSGTETGVTEGTDFDEGTVDGSSPDAIDWSLAGDNPDEDAGFYVDYAIEEDITVNEYEKAITGTRDITVL